MAMLISAGLAATLSVAFSILIGAKRMYADYLEEVAGTTQILASRSAAALAFQDSENARSNLAILIEKNNVVGACLLDTNGQKFAEYSPKKGLARSPCPSESPRWNGAYKEYNFIEQGLTHTLRNVFSQGELVGAISLTSSTSFIRTQIYQQIITGSGVVILALIAVYFVIRSLQKTVSKPLHDVIQMTRQISQSNGQQILHNKYHKDDIALLVDAINAILEKRQEKDLEQSRQIQNILQGYRNSLAMIDYLKSNFHARTLKSLEGVVDITNQRSLGEDIHQYIPYLNDLGEDIQIFSHDIDAADKLSKIYERSISSPLKNINLNDALHYYFGELSLTKAIEVSPVIDWQAHDEAFLKMLEILANMMSSIAFSESSKGLCQLNIEHNISGSVHCLKFLLKWRDLQLSHDLLTTRDNESPWFLEDHTIEEEDFFFIVNSLKYLGGANNLTVDTELGGRSFGVVLEKAPDQMTLFYGA